jgi:hypothetical protein
MPPARRIGTDVLTKQTLLQRLDPCTSACLDSLQTTQTKSASHLQLLLLGSAADSVSKSELAATWPKSVRVCLLSKERALWKMRLYRHKRSSLDRAASSPLRTGDTSKPLVVGVGAGGFAAGGPGQLSAPVGQLETALQRASRRMRRTIIRLRVDEFRTTVCCCSCGRLTRSPWVWHTKTSSWRQSRRFRLCTSVCHGPGGLRRHRDSQAAVNILWCTISQFPRTGQAQLPVEERARGAA